MYGGLFVWKCREIHGTRENRAKSQANLIEEPFRRSWFNRIARVYCHYRSHLGAITRLTIITADPARIRGRL